VTAFSPPLVTPASLFSLDADGNQECSNAWSDIIASCAPDLRAFARKKAAMTVADKIVLQRGDLTEMDVDAIVNAANNDLQLGGGLAGVIRRKGGDAIQWECNEIGAIPVGGAAITSGGKLKARHVIHAASMQLGGQTAARALRTSTAHALRIAAEKGLHTIAFPAIGTGIGGFPVEECAEIMLSEVARHFTGPSTLERVCFVLFDANSLGAFENALREMKDRGESHKSTRAAEPD